MEFKKLLPQGLRLNTGFDKDGFIEVDGYLFVMFYPYVSGVYDLSFGKDKVAGSHYLNTKQLVLAVYDKNENLINLYQSSSLNQSFVFENKLVILDGDTKFVYFDASEKVFRVVKIEYDNFKGGKGQLAYEEQTEDVFILSHDYYTSITGTEVTKCYDALVAYYNQLNPKNKVKKLGSFRRSEFHRFIIKIMINKNMEVEDIQRYWCPPLNNYGMQKYFPNAGNISSVLVV